MKLKTISFLFFLMFYFQVPWAQHMGNAYYNTGYQMPKVKLEQNSAEAPFPQQDFVVNFDVHALMNVKASSYLAIFSLTQIGKTAKEADQILTDRIKRMEKDLDSMEISLERVYVDIISLVPAFEYDTIKKRFSKTSYHEIPVGFELRKNIHLYFKNHDAMDKIITIAADHEIFDLVKVEYFTENPARIQQELMIEAIAFVKTKIRHYSDLGVELDTVPRIVTEDFKVSYPYTRYQSYQAFSSASLVDPHRHSRIRSAEKSTTRYYDKLAYENFDIIIHPDYVEPVVQYSCNLKIKFNLSPPKEIIKKEVETHHEKEFIWLSPQGEMQSLKVIQ